MSLFCARSYELVRNAEIYDRLQCEVDLALGETEGDLGTWTYETYHGLRYLDMCVQETLRMHPPAAYVTRGCSRDYRQVSCRQRFLKKWEKLLYL